MRITESCNNNLSLIGFQRTGYDAGEFSTQTAYIHEIQQLAEACGEQLYWVRCNEQQLVPLLSALGSVTLSTQNVSISLEQPLDFTGMAVNHTADGAEYIDCNESVKFKLRTASYAVAFCSNSDDVWRRSIQFLGMDSRPTQKIFLTESSNHAAFMNFIARCEPVYQIERLIMDEPVQCVVDESSGWTNVEFDRLRADWIRMGQVADLDSLLLRHGLPRLLGFKLIGKNWAAPVSLETFNSRVAMMARLNLSCKFGVDIDKTLHTHVAQMDQFSLDSGILEWSGDRVRYRVDLHGVDSIWAINIPGSNFLTVLEMFDRNGNRIGQMSGDYRSGTQQIWQDIVETFPR